MPDRSPAITVALPTCNGEAHLREALAGLRDQDEVAFDLIVSDDRSDDATLAIVRDLVGDRARVSVNSERLGLAGNWNRCVALASTEWVSVFHQDDVMHPGHLAGHLAAIEGDRTGRLGLVAGRVVMIDGEGRPVPAGVVDPGGLDLTGSASFPPGEWSRFLAIANSLRCSAVTIRNAAHEAVGGFDPSYRYAVDWEFWQRVARGWGLAWLGGPATISMRWHPSSETHSFATGMLDLDEQIRLLDASPDPIDRTAADRRLARAFLNRAHVALKAGRVDLARTCLGRSVQLSRGVLGTIAADPRLAVQMAMLAVLPNQAARWFGPRD